MKSWTAIVLLALASLHSTNASRVLELSDRFLDVRHDGQWLVMFYAPWCAYCKRTEPIWAHVAQALHNTNVRVSRLDCTRFPAVAQEFKISGYPTILFLKNNEEYTYNGDRTKEDILNYVLRMSGPPVQLVTRPESIDTLKTSHSLFFMYIGPENGVLWDTFYAAAEYYQPHGFFYVTSADLAGQHFEISHSPTVIVYKEDNHYHFPHAKAATEMDPLRVNETIYTWINVERFNTFPKVTRNNIHQMMQTNKWLVLAIVEENKLNEVAAHELEFRDMVERVIIKHRKKYHDWFQFGWIGDPDIAHSIVMDILPTPHIIVINSTTQEHHIPDDDPLQMTPQALHLFLESVHKQTAPVYGGNSYFVRIYRAIFEAKKSLKEMWRGNPVLTTVLFGLPMGFLSLILYSIFCADCLDAPEDDEEELHEKKE